MITTDLPHGPDRLQVRTGQVRRRAADGSVITHGGLAVFGITPPQEHPDNLHR
jgi:hypothetical protein